MMVSVSFCKPKKKSSVEIFKFFNWVSLLLVLVFYLHAYMCTILPIFGTCSCFLLQEQMQEVLDAMFEKKVIGFQFC